MQALIVIGRSYDANSKQLHSACRKLVGKTRLARIMDMSASISNSGSRFWVGYREISPPEVCFFRSFGAGPFEQVVKRFGLMRHMETAGTFVVNPVEALLKARDKYTTTTLLAKAGFSIPETYVTESAHWAYRKTQRFGQTVYKPIIGSLGFGAMKFENPDLAFNMYKTIEAMGLPLFLQEYLANPQRDIRAFVIGDRVEGAIYREASQGKWKANIALGSKPKPIRLPKDLEAMALRATKILGLVYAGVDILEAKDGPVLLEVNGSPSWQGLKQASGVDVAERLVKHIMTIAKH